MTPMGKAEWYALVVRARYEKIVARNLASQNYEVFLPLMKSRRRWSDRIKVIEVPLFPGYILARFDLSDRLPALMVPGVRHIVSIGKTPCPIEEDEVEAVRAVMNSRLACEPWPFLAVGQRVRVDYGSLSGLEGLIIGNRKAQKLIVSLSLLQRSVAVEVDRDWVTPVSSVRTGPLRAAVA